MDEESGKTVFGGGGGIREKYVYVCLGKKKGRGGWYKMKCDCLTRPLGVTVIERDSEKRLEYPWLSLLLMVRRQLNGAAISSYIQSRSRHALVFPV